MQWHQAAHGRRITADVFLDRVRKDLQCQPCTRFAVGSGKLQVPHVAAHAGDPEKAGLCGQHLSDLFCGQPRSLHDIREHQGIDVSAAIRHGNARLSRHAHARIHGASSQDGANGRTPAQMTRHQPQRLRLSTEYFRHPTCDVAKGCAVKAQTPDPVALVPLVGEGIEIRAGRHGLVKGGLEQAHKRNARQEISKQPHGGDIGRVVGGKKGNILLHGRKHPVVKKGRARHPARPHHLEADGVQFAEVRQRPPRNAERSCAREPPPADRAGALRRSPPVWMQRSVGIATSRPPIRSIRPCASWRSCGISKTWYFSEVLPTLHTRIFMHCLLSF